MAALVAALLLATAGFSLLNIFRDLVLVRYSVLLEIPITTRIRIDLYGAIVPMVFSTCIAFYLIHYREVSSRRYLSYFLFSICIATILATPSSAGIGFYYVFLALSIGVLVTSITFYGRGIAKLLVCRDLERSEFTRRNYVNALLMAFSYASLSVLVIDFAHALFNAFSSITTCVGGMGLADAIVLSGLSASLGVTFVSLCAALIYEDISHR